MPVYIRYMPVYIRQNTQIYGKYRGFGVLLGLLGGVVPLCSLCPLRVAFCVAARLSELSPTATAISISRWPGISSHTKTQPFLLP